MGYMMEMRLLILQDKIQLIYYKNRFCTFQSWVQELQASMKLHLCRNGLYPYLRLILIYRNWQNFLWKKESYMNYKTFGVTISLMNGLKPSCSDTTLWAGTIQTSTRRPFIAIWSMKQQKNLRTSGPILMVITWSSIMYELTRQLYFSLVKQGFWSKNNPWGRNMLWFFLKKSCCFQHIS